MAQVSIKINGYAYTVGCADGQEDHLRSMAAEVEARMARIKALGSQSGEARLLVLSSLLMADELHDLSVELAGAQGRPRPEPAAAPEPGAGPAQPQGIDPDRIARLAEQAESIAAAMERA